MNSKFFVGSSESTDDSGHISTNSNEKKTKSTFFMPSVGVMQTTSLQLEMADCSTLATIDDESNNGSCFLNQSIDQRSSLNVAPNPQLLVDGTFNTNLSTEMYRIDSKSTYCFEVDKKLDKEEYCQAVANVLLSKVNEKSSQTLAIVKARDEPTSALFIWHNDDQLKITNLDRIIPIDGLFQFNVIDQTVVNGVIQSQLNLTYDPSFEDNDDVDCEKIPLNSIYNIAEALINLDQDDNQSKLVNLSNDGDVVINLTFILSHEDESTGGFLAHLHQIVDDLKFVKQPVISYNWLLKYQVQSKNDILIDILEPVNSILPQSFCRMIENEIMERKKRPTTTGTTKKLLHMSENSEETFHFVDEHFSTMVHHSNQLGRWLSKHGPDSTHRYNDEFDDDEDDDDGDDVFGGETTRDQLIRAITDSRDAEYTKNQQLRILIATWNVNGQMSREEDAMQKHFLAIDKEPPHIYAIGFQELDLSKEAYIFDNYEKGNAWLELCKRSLHTGKKYTMLRHHRLIGMMIIVFVSDDILPHIKNVDTAHVGTGILGKMGNKGGVAVRFDYHHTSVCFVNCHLAAHVEQYERRNQDYREINSRLQFINFNKPKRIEDHDQIYWFGDLNYRVMSLTTEHISTLLEYGQHSTIFVNDQLKRQRELRQCFVGYHEGEIKFAPSYKYDTGTDDWDSSEKRRPPAWCDRVLWRGKGIVQVCYRSHPQLKASDHKPVSALFDSQFPVIDEQAKRRVYEDVMKRLDKEENDYLPQVEIDTTEINFENVKYKDLSLNRSIKLKNVGQSKIRYRFICKPNEPTYCKNWLRISPASSSLAIAETVEIMFELNFDSPMIATMLNYGIEQLSDTLVLSLRGGKDIFITVIASYRPTCFGLSLETLINYQSVPIANCSIEQFSKHYQNSIRNLLKFPNNNSNEKTKGLNENMLLLNLSTESFESNGKFNQLQQFDPTLNPSTTTTTLMADYCPIPKELWLLVDHVYKHGSFKQDLFQCSGSEVEFVQIRDALDNAKSPEFFNKLNVSIDSVAEALLLFLQSLPEPVIPYRFYDRVVENRSNFSNCKQVINDLPEINRKIFEYLIMFLKDLCQFSHTNNLDARIIASIFGPVLIRRNPMSSFRQQQQELVDCESRSNAATIGSSRHFMSSPSSISSSISILSNVSSHVNFPHNVSLSSEQTFIYHFLCNSIN
ncbi:hypothetical protein BLOT_010272 [Blomia tropicalis]|nr:hypothetical protein BLOT_010272 [Blomia tropicalis]